MKKVPVKLCVPREVIRMLAGQELAIAVGGEAGTKGCTLPGTGCGGNALSIVDPPTR